MAIGQATFGRYGLMGGFLLALALMALVFFYPLFRLTRAFASKRLEGQDAWGALGALGALAGRVGVARPRAYLFECAAPAVFSVGVGPWDSAVFLSRSLLKEFAPAEIEAVLAHELLRLARHDCARLTLAAALSSGFAALGRALDAPFAPFRSAAARATNGGLRPGSALVAPIIWLFFAPLVRAQRCFDRDQEAAGVTGDARALARALWKMENYAATRAFCAPLSTAFLFMVNPLTQMRWYRYFIGQPTAEMRIKKLLGHCPP